MTCAHHNQAGTELPPAKPLIYGYIRVTSLADDEVQQLECGLRKLAEAAGFYLAEIRYEYHSACYTTLYRLIRELKQVAARHLVIPSVNHLSAHPLLREQLVMRLHEAHVRVWVVDR